MAFEKNVAKGKGLDYVYMDDSCRKGAINGHDEYPQMMMRIKGKAPSVRLIEMCRIEGESQELRLLRVKAALCSMHFVKVYR